MSYPPPAGAVAPANGYPAGWGPPFSTPRDCLAPDWNHLCPWGRLGRCAATCYGLTATHVRSQRLPGESDHAWLLRTVHRHATTAPDAQPVDAALAEYVRAVRKKRGLAAARRVLYRHGYTVGEADVYLATGVLGAYAGGHSPGAKE